jgi:hypothetical protein
MKKIIAVLALSTIALSVSAQTMPQSVNEDTAKTVNTNTVNTMSAPKNKHKTKKVEHKNTKPHTMPATSTMVTIDDGAMIKNKMPETDTNTNKKAKKTTFTKHTKKTPKKVASTTTQ